MQGLRRCRRDSWGENLVANTYPWLSPSNDSSAGQRLESRKDGRRVNVAGHEHTLLVAQLSEEPVLVWRPCSLQTQAEHPVCQPARASRHWRAASHIQDGMGPLRSIQLPESS